MVQPSPPQPFYPQPPPKQGMSAGAVVAIVLGCVFLGIMIIGILAAVAIPAFMKTARKTKHVESTLNVRRIFDGARAYYEESRLENGTAQFPDSPKVPTAPALGACCMSARGKCAPDPSLWTDPSWQALRFSVDDPHYYSYRYEKSGEGAAATFTAGAYGDLDCDTVYSTFEMVGRISADGTVTGSAGLFRDRELE